jgi:outer membrane protein assembly factor BamE (lipoprotein component of BamABCDE complex)
MHSSISKLIFTASLAVALAGCASLDKLAANSGDVDADRIGQIHAGLTQDEVRGLAGAPGNVTGASRSGNYQWVYTYRDPQGYSTELDVEFDANGKVTSTTSERL